MPYNKLHVGDYEKAYYDNASDVVVLKVNSKENTYTRAIMYKWTTDCLELENMTNREIQHTLQKLNIELSKVLIKE